MEILKRKYRQRKLLSEKRKKIHELKKNDSKLLENNLKDSIIFQKCKRIASFISIKSEISTKFLNEFILFNNKILCFPVVENNSDKLIFRQYNQKKLIKGRFGILHPDDDCEKIIPEVILTPCLGFDIKGNRIGYGGGFYDKTFAEFKKNGLKFISIAVAFEAQKVRQIVNDKFDQKINYILTEKKLYTIK